MSAAEKGSTSIFSSGSVSWATSRTMSSTRQGTSENKTGDGMSALTRSQGQDHTVTPVHRISAHRYPKGCPQLNVRWFYAIDNPKITPSFWGPEAAPQKPKGPPKKFVPFSWRDSVAIELMFQDLADQEEKTRHTITVKEEDAKTAKVPVNEDYLFDVDVRKRELGPVYWLGPIYEVRRGSWFFQDSSTLKPCQENLAIQLEEGYIKLKPWLNVRSQASSGTLRDLQSSETSASDKSKTSDKSKELSKSSSFPSASNGENTYRLFGTYMNSVVTYQDSSVAWIATDDFMTRMSSSVYQRFGAVAGTKVVRGYSEPAKTKSSPEPKGTEDSSPKQAGTDSPVVSKTKRKSAPAGAYQMDRPSSDATPLDRQLSPLERQVSSLIGNAKDAAEVAEEERKQEEREMENSGDVKVDEPAREIDHLILVTHGIGQKLGMRLDSINFVHDVNTLRKTMKSVYAASPDLQTLNSDASSEWKNCRVQVLPVCWRHLLDFPQQGLKRNRKELDLADADKSTPEELYPSLADITLEGALGVRNLITDLAMDVLLYQSHYRDHIAGIVQKESNRILDLFRSRNPGFKGTVSLCGHSLGSAIYFDILCRQPLNNPEKLPFLSQKSFGRKLRDFPLDFDCDNFFCLGSPVPLFQMLEGKTIAAESQAASLESPMIPNLDREEIHGIPLTVSTPRCKELYNIFHPSDPIGYRMEPLISPAMASLKPQPLPFVKRTIWSSPTQSLTNISTQIGQSVGSLWSNFTSGVASSLLNRSLGLSDSSQASSGNPSNKEQPKETDKLDDEETAQIPTLLDSNLETLYDGYQKSQDEKLAKSPDTQSRDKWLEAEARLRRLRNEDAKVRALNTNGRVDYSIQEGAFDISLIASIASHLTYWSDEDVCHFMMSQILSRAHRKHRKMSKK